MPGNDRARKLAYLRIDDESRDLLNGFLPRLREIIPSVLETFYAHVTGEPALAAMFSGEDAVLRAKQAQTSHWERMFSGRFDDEYFNSVDRIGKTHARLGLDPGSYLGGYSLVKQALFEVVLSDSRKRGFGRKAGSGDPIALLAAIDKAITLDMDLSIETYLAEQDRRFNEHLNQLADQFGDAITTIVSELTETATKLQSSTADMSENICTAGDQVNVARSGAESASDNLQTIASAAEELSSSISEISRQIHESSRVTQDAVGKAEQMDKSVSTLQEAAVNVGGIVRLIEEIADQTNLLALNATIEAARAGEAGRGFAVVAGEVKSLAQQTANATGEIANQIKEIQDVAQIVGDHIEMITSSISSVQNVSATISGAMEEQTAVTQEISGSVTTAASGSASVSDSVKTVSMSAEKCQMVSQEIVDIVDSLRKQATTLGERSTYFIGEIRNGQEQPEADLQTAA